MALALVVGATDRDFEQRRFGGFSRTRARPSKARRGVYAATTLVNLRKGFDGLGCVVRQGLAGDPLSGHPFVFARTG